MRILITLLSLLMSISLCAQKKQYFTTPVEGFSKKKVTYITLQDGTELEGKIKKLVRKRGLFEQITLNVNGENQKIAAAEIKDMYIPQSGLDKFGDMNDLIGDATRWDSEDVNMEHIKDGYAYYQTSEVLYKKKKQATLLLQVVNPAFAGNVTVFHNPFATETASASIGGFKVAGGIDKSYFFKKGDGVAYKVMKKDYKDQIKEIFGDCSQVFKAAKKSGSWSKFPEYLHEYATTCGE